MRSLADALPSSHVHARSPLTGPPPGYVSPLEDQGFDRYAAHPAAPASHQEEGRATTIGSSNDGSSPKANDYIPLGYARPPREVQWNREGPAMRTHGIAWLREGEAEALPDRPVGPRMVQARPPRAAFVEAG